jgi:hypothetical protein
MLEHNGRRQTGKRLLAATSVLSQSRARHSLGEGGRQFSTSPICHSAKPAYGYDNNKNLGEAING